MTRHARSALTFVLAISLAGGFALMLPPGAAAQENFSLSRERDFERNIRRANPSAVVAAELAFAHAAQEKGQWTAFADFAAKDAVMFVPQAVIARDWLKKQQNPAQAVRWQPHQIWSSCDGTLAVSKGAWQRPDGSTGYFTTVWQRQRKGEYKWVMDQGDGLDQPLAEPEMIGGAVADCPAGFGRPGGPRRGGQRQDPTAAISAPACGAGGCRGGGTSADGTLVYAYSVAPSGAREFTVQLRQQGEMREVLRSEVAAE